MKGLNGKVAVITGGNSGIGLGVARLLHEQGAQVITNCRNEKRLQETKAEYGDLFAGVYQADLADIVQVNSFFETIGEEFGQIDILFLNAGVVQFYPIEYLTEEHYDEHFNLNVKGMMFSVKAALPFMKEDTAILLNSSTNAHRGIPMSSVYSGSKAAITAIAKVLAAELAPRGIRVNTITPGPIQTPIIKKMNMTEEQLRASSEFIRGNVPLKRFGEPAEVATLVLEVATNRFITGQEFIIDGGLTAV